MVRVAVCRRRTARRATRRARVLERDKRPRHAGTSQAIHKHVGIGLRGVCLDRLATVFRARKWSFVSNPRDESSNEELWDGLATRDDTAIVIECKGTFIKSVDKYSGEPIRFFRGLTQKFGHVSMAGSINSAGESKRYGSTKPRRVPFAVFAQQSTYFRSWSFQDPIITAGPVMRVLSDRFLRSIKPRLEVGGPKVWPLTVTTADALDRLSAVIHVTGERLDSILKSFHRAHPSRMISLEDFMARDGDRFNTEAIRALIKARFDETAERAMQRFRSGDYGGTARDEAAVVPPDPRP